MSEIKSRKEFNTWKESVQKMNEKKSKGIMVIQEIRTTNDTNGNKRYLVIATASRENGDYSTKIFKEHPAMNLYQNLKENIGEKMLSEYHLIETNPIHVSVSEFTRISKTK